jgi:hypothetical protein
MRLVRTGGYQNHETGVEDWRISEPLGKCRGLEDIRTMRLV